MLPVEYCTATDGVRIAFTTEGDGPPLLFTHFVYAFSLSHYVPTFDNALRQLARGRRLIRYDIRGTGLSQRDVADVSPATDLMDLEAVVRALGLQRFAMMGVAHGGIRAVEYAVRHPEQITHLVLYEAYPRLLDAFPRQVLQALAQLARANWSLATRTFVDTGIRREDELEGRRWAEMLEASVTGDMIARTIEDHVDHDVTHLLGQVQCPTLVCHSRNDRLYPFELGERMARQIPGARLIPLEAETGGPFTDPREAIDAMSAFLPRSDAVAPGSDDATVGKLSPREMDILRLIAAGRTSSEISYDLSLSIRTVGRHITNLYRKIGARGRADATSYALRHQIANE